MKNHFKHDIQISFEGVPKKVFRALRKLKNVNRLSGFSLIQKYSDAEHCYYVGVLYKLISNLLVDEDLLENCDFEAEFFAFTHDILESVTGDLLRPVKNFNEEVHKLWALIEDQLMYSEEYSFLGWYKEGTRKLETSEKHWKLFMICDVLELLIFCNEEQLLGNITPDISTVISNCEGYLLEICPQEWRKIVWMYI